jgi:hypothetical protein
MQRDLLGTFLGLVSGACGVSSTQKSARVEIMGMTLLSNQR